VANRFQQRGNRKDTAKVLAMEALTSMCVCVCVWAWRFITTIYFYICLASCVEMGQCERIEPLKIAQKLPKRTQTHTRIFAQDLH